MFGHRDVVLELLKHGADPDQPSSGDDWTPMVHASRCCHHEIVQDLFPTADGGCIIIYDFLKYPDFSVKLAKINSNGIIDDNWNNIVRRFFLVNRCHE